MRHRALAAILCALFVVGTACQAAPGAPSSEATPAGGQVKPAERLTIATSSDDSSWNPYTYRSGYPGWQVLLLQYDTLMIFDRNSVAQPWLAREVKANADSTVWTLTMEKGVKWHDGRDLTAADVKFTYDYMRKNVHGRWTSNLLGVKSVEVQGTDTVVITTDGPRPTLPERTLADIPIMPQHIWADVTEPTKAIDLKFSVGSGPYQLVEFKPTQLYRFKANPSYFKGPVMVGEIVMPVILEATPTFAALRGGQLDSTVRLLQPEMVKDVEATPGMKVMRGPEFSTTSLQLNVERPGLDRKEVRQAISLAIDRKKLVDTVYLGYATPGAAGFLHPENPNFNKDIKTDFDVSRANALLDRIGATRGADGTRVLDGRPLRYSVILPVGRGPLVVRTAELLAADLRAIGIAVTVEALENRTWSDRLGDVATGRASNFDMTMMLQTAPWQFGGGWLAEQVHSDPRKGGRNTSRIKDPAGDRLADRVFVESDPQKRAQLTREMQAFIADQQFIVTLLWQDGIYAYRQAAYDGWVFQKGLGIYQKHSFIGNRR